MLAVDEPALAMTIGVNTSPLRRRVGGQAHRRQLDERLRAELVGNVSIQVRPTESTDAWEVPGRGELSAGGSRRTMRREGFELTVGSRGDDARINGRPSSGGGPTADRHTRNTWAWSVGLLGARRPDGSMVTTGTGSMISYSSPPAAIGVRTSSSPSPRDRNPPLGLRVLRAMARRNHHPGDGLPGRRPARHHRVVRADEPAGTRPALRGPGRAGL